MPFLDPPPTDNPSPELEMPQNIPSAFEGLPVEVLGHILRLMASPEDLYSTIRASPMAFRSFLWFREDVLIHVLEAHLPAEIFAELVGLLHIPKYEDYNYVPSWSDTAEEVARLGAREESRLDEHWEWAFCKCTRGWSVLVNQFFKTHFENVNVARSSGVQRYSKPQASQKPEINYLMSIYGMLKRFTRDYQLFVRRNLTDAPTSPGPDPSSRLRGAQLLQDWPSLSGNETLRLYRGFLRYELCCRLYIMPGDGAHLQYTFWFGSIFKPLSNYLHRWEEEEIRCVWTYVRTQYRVLARDVVEDFCCDVWRLSREARNAPDEKVTIAPSFTPEDASLNFAYWERSMSCLGLPLIQQLLRSGVDFQRRFLKNTNLRRVPGNDGFWFLPREADTEHEWHDRANDVYKSIALAISTSEDGKVSWLHDDEADNGTGLQEMGWVFWEHPSRVRHFVFPGSDVDGHDISHYLTQLHHRGRKSCTRQEIGARYPEQTMYVTREGHQELLEKYADHPLEELGFVSSAYLRIVERLRAISDWPSKEVSPAFQEVCSGPTVTE